MYKLCTKEEIVQPPRPCMWCQALPVLSIDNLDLAGYGRGTTAPSAHCQTGPRNTANTDAKSKVTGLDKLSIGGRIFQF